MSDHFEGIVQKITEKATRNGGTMYNVCMDTGQEDEWFGHGFDEPQFLEGDEVAFDVTYNGEYANIDTNTVDILAEGEGAPAKPKPKPRGRAGRAGSSKPAPRGQASRSAPSKSRAKPAADDKMSKEEWANKDKIIRRQACMNTAIALISAAVVNDLVALPTKKAYKLDAFIALCDKEAIRLYAQYEEQVHSKPKAASRRGAARNTRDDEYDDDIPE